MLERWGGGSGLSGADATPPPCRAPRCSYTPVAAHSAVLSVCSRGVAATPPPKAPAAPLSLSATAGVVAGALTLENPVALQGVEQLHCSVSRYTFPLRVWLGGGGLRVLFKCVR